MELTIIGAVVVAVVIGLVLFMGRGGGRKVGFGSAPAPRSERRSEARVAPAAAPVSNMRPPATRKAPTDGAIPAEIVDEVDALLADRRKIEAIKVVREATGMGLKDAKEAVERHARGRG